MMTSKNLSNLGQKMEIIEALNKEYLLVWKLTAKLNI